MSKDLTDSFSGLDEIMVVADQKTEEGKRIIEECALMEKELEEKRKQEDQLQLDIVRQTWAAIERQAEQITNDIAKYQKIADNVFAQDLKNSAWDALVAIYPEAKEVPRHDVAAFSNKLEMEATYIDPQTGLIWLRNGNIAGMKMSWENARWQMVDNFYYGHIIDWRLPTKEELESIAKMGSEWLNANGFKNVQDVYWSGSGAWAYGETFYKLWAVDMKSGKAKRSNERRLFYVWPVSDGRLEEVTKTEETPNKTRYFGSIIDIDFFKQYYKENGFKQFLNKMDSTQPETRIEMFNYRLKFWLIIAIFYFIYFLLEKFGEFLGFHP